MMSKSNLMFMDRLARDSAFAAEVERYEENRDEPGQSYFGIVHNAANLGYALLLVRKVANRLDGTQATEIRALRIAVGILEKSTGTPTLNESAPF